MRPSFLIVGAQRCGTTSLHRALVSHPNVVAPLFHKGVNYFDVNYHRGQDWYRGHFPVEAVARARVRPQGGPVTGESSGYYMFHPLAAERIARDLPEVKVIVMLRDPVERAYSAYKHELARGFETESFPRALELETDRLRGEVERMIEDPTYESFSHRHHAYLGRGAYVQQIRPFEQLLGRRNVLIVDSADFFAHPHEEYLRMLDFLGLPPWSPQSFDQHNARPGRPLPTEIRHRLEQHFEGLDEELAALSGVVPSWRR